MRRDGRREERRGVERCGQRNKEGEEGRAEEGEER